MKKILFILIGWLSVIGGEAQSLFSDSVQISLLTVEPGKDAYECFGHTGIRVRDLKQERDIVFHYGVYNYTEPNFVWHFIEGKCNYQMGALYTASFVQQHQRRHLGLWEQELALDSAQSNQLVEALLTNYRPENRNYRYNFFFDNCATRPFDMITRYSSAVYDTTWVESITLRDMVQEMSGKGNWLDFGISLAVAGRADHQASFKEQMFLPKYLAKALENSNLVQHASWLVQPTPSVVEESALSPMLVAVSTLLIALLISVLQWLKKGGKKVVIAGRIFDSIWLLASGIAGCIIWFLNFYSLHPAVDHNLNCWWLLPTNLLFIAFIWIKKAEKVRRIYFFIIFAAVIIYIISVCASDQFCHPAFVPMLLAIAIRCIANKKS